MAVTAVLIFLLTAFSLAIQLISRSKRKSRAAVVVWCGEDISCEDEILGIIRDEEAGEYGRKIILVSRDGRFSRRTEDIADKYGLTLTSAERLADIICHMGNQVKANTWEVKNE